MLDRLIYSRAFALALLQSSFAGAIEAIAESTAQPCEATPANAPSIPTSGFVGQTSICQRRNPVIASTGVVRLTWQARAVAPTAISPTAKPIRPRAPPPWRSDSRLWPDGIQGKGAVRQSETSSR